MGFSVEEDVKELQAKVIILDGQVAAIKASLARLETALARLNDMVTKKGGIIHVEEKTDDARGLS